METSERFGRYHVLGPIARGGMAEVFRVKTVGLAGFEKIQALKRIAPAQSHEPRFIRSFIDEARIAAELTHKNVVQVFDFGEVDGVLYLTMELVDGSDLRTMTERARAAGLSLPAELAAHIIAELGTGLDYAHRKADPAGRPLGIVHCDVSPANVMVSSEGHVKILDFGVARASFAHALERRRLRGKPRYMAPEQTRGEQPTPATDVFALGLVAWELLTGGPLFDGTDVASTLAAVRTMPVPPIDRVRPEVPLVLARALERALVRDPDSRGSAIELARAANVAAGGASARGLAAWLADVEAATAPTTALGPSARRGAGVAAPPLLAEATVDTVTRSRVGADEISGLSGLAALVPAPVIRGPQSSPVPVAVEPGPTAPLRKPAARPLAAAIAADAEEPSAVTALVDTRLDTRAVPSRRTDPFGWREDESADGLSAALPQPISQGTVDAAFAKITDDDPFAADTGLGPEDPFAADTGRGADVTTDVGFEILGEEVELPREAVADPFAGNTETGTDLPDVNADATIDQAIADERAIQPPPTTRSPS